jgi:hypothetical protein
VPISHLRTEVFSDVEGNSLLWLACHETMTKENISGHARTISNRIWDLRKLGHFSGEKIFIRDGILAASDLTDADFRSAFARWKRRMGGTEVYVLTTSQMQSRVILLDEIAHASCMTISEISSIYLSYNFRKSDNIYTMNNGYSFELPGKQHSNSFLRIGNSQRDYYLLDDYFFFLFDYIHKAKSLVAETWSISTLCYHVAERMNARTGNGPRPYFLSRYFDGSHECEDEAFGVFTRLAVDNCLPAVIIFSAVFSGASWNALQKKLQARLGGSSKLTAVSLVKLASGSPIDSLSTVVIETKESPSKSPKRTLPINKKTYFPDFMDTEEVDIRPYIGTYKNFFERYAGKEIFHVHTNSHSNQAFRDRHNAFYVKFDNMVKTREFQHKIVETLKNRSAPMSVMCLDTLSNRSMLEHIKTIFGSSFEIYCEKTFEALDVAILRNPPVGPIWVVDSIVVTGWTLSEFAKLVRDRLSGQGVTILVGLDRPSESKMLTTRSNHFAHILGADDAYLSVEKVILPNWNVDRCPWCRESRLLNSINNLNEDEIDSRRNRRKRRLMVARPPLFCDNIFLNDDVQENAEDEFDLGERSLFLDVSLIAPGQKLSHGDVINCVAAVAQQWRTDANAARFKRATIVDVICETKRIPESNAVGATTFNDPVLRAALWRVFDIEELLPVTGDALSSYYQKFGEIINSSSQRMHACLKLEALFLLRDRIKNIEIRDGILDPYEAHIGAELKTSS